MSIKRALIVDDEPDLCQLAEITLNRMGIDTISAHNVKDAESLLSEHEFNLCLTDMNLPDGNGIDLVKHIQQSYSHIPVAVITAYGNMESAVLALKAGAFDFISKPVDLNVLRGLVESSLKLKHSSESNTSTHTIIGESVEIEHLNKQLSKLARSQAPIFIHGESGTGKELAAKQIHLQSSRADQAFIPVNCGAIPSELMESEFFGHLKGSFTGATTDKTGLFMSANNGTLFLDEVAELPLHMQVKLLRALQEKSIKPVGSHSEINIDVRILSASHQDLNQLVQAGQFRQDLYYRINVIELEIPSLRERKADIPLLIQHFIQKISARMQLDNSFFFNDKAISKLCEYSFPGNIRELENMIERALALAESNEITENEINIPNEVEDLSQKQTHDTIRKHQNLSEHEREAIVDALDETRWNQAAAARLLGLTPRQLRYRIKKLNIE
jgi:two-component system, NtrC family, response regulator PilR